MKSSYSMLVHQAYKVTSHIKNNVYPSKSERVHSSATKLFFKRTKSVKKNICSLAHSLLQFNDGS